MAAQANVISDLSTYTKIPNKILNELIKKEALCIGSAINDALTEKETETVINIGIGTLSVDLTTMQCKFIPSKELKTIIKKSIDEKIDPVEMELEQTLIDKLMSICDEAF